MQLLTEGGDVDVLSDVLHRVAEGFIVIYLLLGRPAAGKFIRHHFLHDETQGLERANLSAIFFWDEQFKVVFQFGSRNLAAIVGGDHVGRGRFGGGPLRP